MTAGCGAILDTLSPDGRALWVSDFSSNALVGYSTARMLHDSSRAISAVVRVGHGPVGLAFVDHGRRLLVADTGRNSPHVNKTGNLAVVDPAAALAGRPSLLGFIPVVGVPRVIRALPRSALAFVTNYESQRLILVSSHTLP